MWKDRGLWANYGTNFIWHIEGGKAAYLVGAGRCFSRV